MLQAHVTVPVHKDIDTAAALADGAALPETGGSAIRTDARRAGGFRTAGEITHTDPDMEPIARMILELNPDGISMMDLDTGRFRFVNPTLAEMTGFPQEELEQMTADDIIARVSAEDRNRLSSQFQQIRSGQLEAFESTYRWQVRNGEYRWFSDHCRLMRNPDGMPLALLRASRDMTEHKVSQDKIAFQAHLLESVNDAICAMDSNCAITYWNAMAEDLFGWSAAEAIGRQASELLRTVPRNQPGDNALLNMVAAGYYRGEAACRHKDGHVILARVHSRVIRDSQGQVREIVASFHDITERVKAEDALRVSEAHALSLVEQLRQADRCKNRFISILSHELRNPLAAIVVSLSLLEHHRVDAGQASRARDVIRRQTDQLSHLVDDLLDVTRISENRIKLSKEPVELGVLVQRTIGDFQAAYAEKRVALSAEMPPEPVHLSADPVRLTQAISNLLHNALKYTPPEGSVHIDVLPDAGRRRVDIRIRDTGIGIEPEMIETLFQPFTQADSSFTRASGGLGLGLAIVRGMVELHGGRVIGASEGLDKGTQFTIQLPLD